MMPDKIITNWHVFITGKATNNNHISFTVIPSILYKLLI